jgi:hypothetical protein
MQDSHSSSDNPPTDPRRPHRPMSEISHLFLSNIRDRTRNGAPTPQRKPPVNPKDVSIDLTPEEFAQVFSDSEQAASPLLSEDAPARRRAAVHAVLASHLNGHRSQRLREYAWHLCIASAARIGLIDIDQNQLRLSVFEHSREAGPVSDEQAAMIERMDARRISQTLEEITWDVDHWLLIVQNPRSPEGQRLLQLADRWVLLTAGDHDGVVSGYRTLKSLSELNHPRLSLALLDLTDELQARRICRKLDSVCQQFLRWPIEQDVEMVVRASGVIEHVVLSCVGAPDGPAGPHWQVIAQFLERQRPEQAPLQTPQPATAPQGQSQSVSIPRPGANTGPVGQNPTPDPLDAIPEVIDLPDDAPGNAGLAAALVRGLGGLVPCPIKPPMCPEASLAVTRDRQLLLVAAASQGLSDLRLIGRAYQWLIENRPLVAMALPQFNIDAHRLPRLELLVDHADLSADILQPLLASGNVLVRAYRKLRWAGKTGLLLEAA